MSTIQEELRKRNITEDEIEILVKNISEANIVNEEEIFKYLNSLNEKYLTSHKIIEIYIRYEKLIPFQSLNTQQAYIMFLSIKDSMKQKDRQIIENFFRSAKGTKVNLKKISEIFLQVMKNNFKIVMPCMSIMYYVNNEVCGIDNEDDKLFSINIKSIYDLFEEEKMIS